MKIKFSAAKALPLLASVLTVASMIVDHKRQSVDRNELKAELKTEVLKELLSNED